MENSFCHCEERSDVAISHLLRSPRPARAGLHTLIARIVEGNAVSAPLHEAVGFQHVGVMREVGHKFGRLLDVHLMQKVYEAPPAPEA